MTWHRRALVLAGALVCARAHADSPWIPEPLSPAARRVVHTRMDAHAREMSALIWNVLLLQYDQAVVSATAIAKAATPLDRNAPELEHHVYFFTLQDQLRTRALGLADAARTQDGLAVSKAFKLVTETCVHCHVVYLESGPRRASKPVTPPAH